MTPEEALEYLAGPEPLPTSERKKSAEWKMYGSPEAERERNRKLNLRAEAIRVLQACIERCKER